MKNSAIGTNIFSVIFFEIFFTINCYSSVSNTSHVLVYIMHIFIYLIKSVKEGDKLTVRFTDVGEGWLQCEDAHGIFLY